MMRYLCVCVIILAAGISGGLYKRSLSVHRKELENLIYALGLLKTEIAYAGEWLGECFFHIGKRIDGEIGMLFMVAETVMKEDSGCNGLLTALSQRQEKLTLSESELDILRRLGNDLGTCDLESELRRIDYAFKATEAALKTAAETEKKWGRVYGFGGWLCGLTAALFFI